MPSCAVSWRAISLTKVSSGWGIKSSPAAEACWRKNTKWSFFPGDDLFAASRPCGLPIGNLTSQSLANCYLNSFDHFVKRELHCPAYVRSWMISCCLQIIN